MEVQDQEEEVTFVLQEMPGRSPREFRGMPLHEVVSEAMDEASGDLDVLGKDLQKYALIRKAVTEALSKRLATLNDEYVLQLEEELRAAEDQIQVLEEMTDDELRNENRFRDQIITYLLYVFNDGDPLEVRLDRLDEFSDVEFGYKVVDEDSIKLITIEESEQ